MKTLLAVHSYPGANDTIERHWPYFLRQRANFLFGVGTEDGTCRFPKGAASVKIGNDSYINGAVLPKRMLNTLAEFLDLNWDVMILAEYDTVFFQRINVEQMIKPFAGHYAGGRTWQSKASCFYHNPWVFSRSCVDGFIREGWKAIADGVCGEKTSYHLSDPEGSPDVFFAYVIEQLGCEVEVDL